MPTLDDEIARHLAQAAASGELRAARGYGRPLPQDEGWDATPEALRMPFKILRDAGCVPPEVTLFRERADLRASLEASADPVERQRLQARLAELEQKLALRLEALRRHAAS
ncbi:MAG: DnaJ family domain-containing protein [Ramlibacter sp.]